MEKVRRAAILVEIDVPDYVTDETVDAVIYRHLSRWGEAVTRDFDFVRTAPVDLSSFDSALDGLASAIRAEDGGVLNA